MEKVSLNESQKNSVKNIGSLLARWFQITVTIKLFGVVIFHRSFPPDDDDAVVTSNDLDNLKI